MNYDALVAYEKFRDTIERILDSGKPVGFDPREEAEILARAGVIRDTLQPIIEAIDALSLKERLKREQGLNALSAFIFDLDFIVSHLFDLRKLRDQNTSKGRASKTAKKERLIEAITKIACEVASRKVSRENANRLRPHLLQLLQPMDLKNGWPSVGTVKDALSELNKRTKQQEAP